MTCPRNIPGILVPIVLAFLISCSSTTNRNLEEMIEIKHNWTFSEKGKEQWMEAAVPGCVHTDLIRNGLIEDPFYRLNEHDVQTGVSATSLHPV